MEAFRRLFQDKGLPAAMRSDNGLPFASPNGLYNLSRLSVFWLNSASRSKGSSQGTLNRMAAMSACTSP